MIMLEKLNNLFRPAKLSRARIILALFVAVVADGLQILLPVPPAPEIVDVIAMALTMWLLGFHVLLLPTFVVEFLPLVDMLPTWTGCVIAVIALRKRDPKPAPPATDVVESNRVAIPPAQSGPPKIDLPPDPDSNPS